MRTACDYVHLNPVCAHLLRQERLLAYSWSSFAYCLAAPEHRPQWVRVDRLLGEHGLQQDTAAARQQFELRMEARRLESGDEPGFKALRRGWYLGSEHFKNQLLEQMDGKLGGAPLGPAAPRERRCQSRAAHQRRTAPAGWNEAELVSRRKSDPIKLAIAARLRRETTLPIKSIAARLDLGTSKSANARLHAAMNSPMPVRSVQACLGM